MSRNGRWLCLLFAVLLAFAGLQSTPVVCPLPDRAAAEEAMPCITTLSTSIAVAQNCTRELLAAQESRNPDSNTLRREAQEGERTEIFPVALCPDIFVLPTGKHAERQEEEQPQLGCREQVVIEHMQKSDGKKRTQLCRSYVAETDKNIQNKKKRREDSTWVNIYISERSVSFPSVHGS